MSQQTVWVYGDGNSARVMAYLPELVDPSVWEIVDLTFPTSNPAGDPGRPEDLAERFLVDAAQNPLPDVVWIGYAASGWSLLTIALGKYREHYSAREADAILRAADVMESTGIGTVLLSRGPGCPDTDDECTRLGARAHQVVWQRTRKSGLPHIDWSLPRTDPTYWDLDQVHVSADPELIPTADAPSSEGALTVAARVASWLNWRCALVPGGE